MANFLDQLFQSPSFLTGVSLLGGQTKDIGPNILGVQKALAQQELLKQEAAQNEMAMDRARSRQLFNPADYISPDRKIDIPRMLSTGIASGYAPTEISALANQMGNRYVPIPAGGLLDPATGERVVGPRDPVANPTVVGLDQLLSRRDSYAPGSPNWKIYDNMIQHVTGVDAATRAAAKAPSGYYNTGQTDENGAPIFAPSPGGPADVNAQNKEQARQDRLAKQQEQQAAQKQRFIDSSRQRFTAQLERTNIPQMEAAVGDLEQILKQYPEGAAVPGFGVRDSLLPDALLSEEGKRNRQAAARVQNLQIKTLSGASTSNQEILRNQKQMGTGTLMSVESLRRGLAGLRSGLESEKKNAAAGVNEDVYRAYLDAGGIDLGRTLKEPSDVQAEAPAAKGGSKPSQAEAVQELRRRGLLK